VSSKGVADAIQYVFRDVYDTESDLGVLTRRAVEGFESEDHIWQVMDARGSKGACALLRFLTDLPGGIGISNGQFAVGYTPGGGPIPDSLATWNEFLAEALKLAMVDIDKADRARIPEVCERLMDLIRTAATLATPRLRAWG
jgi:hypothetical protein